MESPRKEFPAYFVDEKKYSLTHLSWAAYGFCLSDVTVCNAKASNVKNGIETKKLALHGIEPWTSALLARRSNQLSYKAILLVLLL